MDGQCHKSCSLDVFKWVENTSQFNKDFIQNYNEDSHEGYFLEVDVQYPGILHDLHNRLPFLPKIMKIEKKWKTFRQLAWKKKML